MRSLAIALTATILWYALLNLIGPRNLIVRLFDAEAVVNGPQVSLLIYRPLAFFLGLLTLWLTVRTGEWISSRLHPKNKGLHYKPVPAPAMLMTVIIAGALWFIGAPLVIVVSYPVLHFFNPLPSWVKDAWFVMSLLMGLVLASFIAIRLFDKMLLGFMYVGRFLLYYACATVPLGYVFVASMFGLPPIGFLLLGVWQALATIIAPSLTGLILGFKLAPSYVYLDLTIEPAPPGSHTITQFGFEGDLKDRVRASNHSLAYQSTEIISSISAWVRKVSSEKLLESYR